MLIQLLAGALLLLLAACAPQQVEVTREVPVNIPVTVEVTRLVTEQVVQEVAVEVTRLIEVVVEPTATAEAPATTEMPSPTPEPPATPVSGARYTVRAGDTLATIADGAGISVQALQAANNMNDSTFLIAGQELVVPGLEGELVVAQAEVSAAATAVPEAPTVAEAPLPAPAGGNLLPNPSFEGDWHFYLYNELQVPDGWQLATDEGPNNLEQGAGGLFNRPEVRVVPSKDLPPQEHSLFVLDGDKTVKAFKGGAPTSFSMFTDLALDPGTYRLQIRFVPDTVVGYDNRTKVYSSNPLDAEARIIVGNGGTGWQGTASGQPNTLYYDFSLEQPETVRIGGSFRNRQIMVNNGWFLDDWSLTRLQ